jgi:hypothetical protein
MFQLLSVFGCDLVRSELYRGETDELFRSGNRAYGSGQFQDALNCYERVLALDPSYAQASANLGHVAFIREDFEAAVYCYRRAVALEPDLEASLKPFLAAASERRVRAHLAACGLDLRQVWTLLRSKREGELEKLLEDDVPFQLLAGDGGSLSLKERSQLEALIVDRAYEGDLPPRCRLFSGYFLYLAGRWDRLALKVLQDSAKESALEAQQEILTLIGHLYLRLGRENRAADAYLKAVEAGKPMAEVAPALARIYGLTVEEWLDGPDGSGKVVGAGEGKPPFIKAEGLSTGKVGP